MRTSRTGMCRGPDLKLNSVLGNPELGTAGLPGWGRGSPLRQKADELQSTHSPNLCAVGRLD